MTATPLQLANAMCVIANKGYYFIPHFVKSIDNETKKDTLLNKYRQRHNVLTGISNADYELVSLGMQDVVERGTAVSARIPGINICAKTGTAQNFRIIRRKRVELNENSMFVCFAPRENPKIAIAVVVENAGYGSTSAGPIASLLMEKYLNDTLRTESVKKIEELANKDLMPSILKVEQHIADSLRAVEWFRITKDSSYLRKYTKPGLPSKKDSSKPKDQRIVNAQVDALQPRDFFSFSKKRVTT